MSIGTHIYYWRIKKNMTQNQLAHVTGIPQPNLSNIEKNKVDLTLSTLQKICFALKIKISELLDEAETPASGLSRDDQEKIAHAVLTNQFHGLKKNIKHIAQLFQHMVQTNQYRPKKQIYSNWLEIKKLLSDTEIKNILSRIDKKRQIT